MDEDVKKMFKEMSETVTNAVKGLKADLDSLKGSVVKPDEPVEKDDKGKAKTGSPEELAETILKMIDKRNAGESSQVFDTLYEEKVNELTEKYGAFSDHLNSEDDYGDKIGDKIKGITDYKQRVGTLERVFKSFVGARSSESDASDLRINAETKEKLENDNKQLDGLKDKFENGDITEDEFTTQFFGAMETQLDRLA